MSIGAKAKKMVESILHGGTRPREDDDAHRLRANHRTRGRQVVTPSTSASPVLSLQNVTTHLQHDDDMATVFHRPITPTPLSSRSQSKAHPRDPERRDEENQIDHVLVRYVSLAGYKRYLHLDLVQVELRILLESPRTRTLKPSQYIFDIVSSILTYEQQVLSYTCLS
jgi:hypothetical protein